MALLDFVLLRPSTRSGLALGCDLAEVFRAAFRGLLPALRTERGSGRLFEQIVGQVERSGEKFVCALRALFGKDGRAENVVRVAYHPAKRFQIVLLACHAHNVAATPADYKRLLLGGQRTFRTLPIAKTASHFGEMVVTFVS